MNIKPSSVFDYNEALRRVDQDLEIFHTLVELFVEHGPKDCAAIKAALEAHDPAAVAHYAHRLKGSVMQFCAPTVLEAAVALETMGKVGDLASAGPTCAALETNLFRLIEALRCELDNGLAA
jgi:HPt (histidine-containing phosphotransfer) domain-containing protein